MLYQLSYAHHDVAAILAAIAPYGALQPFLEDPEIEEIWINSPQRIFVARKGKSELTNLVLTKSQVQAIMDRILLWSGKRIDLSQPFVDARLPDGSRLHIAIPEITAEHWAINIRKHLMRGKNLEDLRNLGVMDEQILELLRYAVERRLNILVSGSTQAGKTTLLNALVRNLEGIGAISIRRLIKEALRMRPSRIVIGEIREAESLDLLIALNSGVPGMATLHANSALEAIRKLQTLPLLAGENITQDFIAPAVARAIDLVIHVGIDEEGRRRILEVSVVTERIEGLNIEIERVLSWNENQYVAGLGRLP
ncbi:MAG: CpaF family protein [Actinobacteria bacterium]|nr:CpaF family protein [Actinomycetota bacterium]